MNPRFAVISSCLMIAAVCAGEARPSEADALDDALRPALLSYGPDRRTARCFSTSFLELLRLETTVRAGSGFVGVALDSSELFEHPFAIFSGEGAFELSERETRALGDYLRRGGFVLASSGCSNHAWAVSFERAIRRAVPEASLTELSLDHPVFNTLFEVSELVSRKRQPVRMMGVELNGRLALLYSPQGLNDTRNVGAAAPGECCCCGGDEIVGAKYINAGALLYALAP